MYFGDSFGFGALNQEINVLCNDVNGVTFQPSTSRAPVDDDSSRYEALKAECFRRRRP